MLKSIGGGETSSEADAIVQAKDKKTQTKENYNREREGAEVERGLWKERSGFRSQKLAEGKRLEDVSEAPSSVFRLVRYYLQKLY